MQQVGEEKINTKQFSCRKNKDTTSFTKKNQHTISFKKKSERTISFTKKKIDIYFLAQAKNSVCNKFHEQILFVKLIAFNFFLKTNMQHVS